MKSKKILLVILCVILVAVVVGALCIGMRVAPTVNHTLRISELLQPVLNAENQMMHIAVSAKVDGQPIEMESDIFLVTEDGVDFVALEQNGNAVFASGNVLFLENGKAFKIGDDLQKRMTSYQDLLPQIGVLYNALKITAEETEHETVYSITITGDQVDTLLAVASAGEVLPVDGIEKLNLCLTERNGKLEQIRFSGNGELDGTSVALNVSLSGFRTLAAGDYPIPEEVKESAATVDSDQLFNLTEDLYRLVLALSPFADMESIDGSLNLVVDCGPIQLDTKLQLSDLQASSDSVDYQKLRGLPEMLGWLCIEGDISCTPEGNAYVYVLKLDQQSMQALARMISPELAQYGGKLTEGSATIILESGRIASMCASISGKINALITQIPITILAEFSFD